MRKMIDTTIRNLKLDYQITLGTRDKSIIMDETSVDILKAIEKKGSLNFALMMVGLSYRSGWGKIKRMENELGFPLIKSIRGGPEGGSSTLTREGKLLIHAYDKICGEIDLVLKGNFNSTGSGDTIKP